VTTERRNLYRVLHVQPEAPTEIIKACYRTLMSSLRAHPDLGGDPARAATINQAYDVLMDADKRRLYDQALAHRARARSAAATGAASASANTTAAHPAAPATRSVPTGPPASALSFTTWQADRRCPFCRTGFRQVLKVDSRCTTCDSPLTPAPEAQSSAHELLGRRCSQRHLRDVEVCLRLPGITHDLAARLRNLSLTGMAFSCSERIARGSVVRVISPQFDTLAGVVQQRSSLAGPQIHAKLLTLQLQRIKQGVFVSVTA
jgi:DnaJ domain